MEDSVREPDRPNLIFETGSFSLPELLESHLLPVVVQYDAENQPSPSELNFDLSQPLLLYKKRNIQKVSAKSLCIKSGRYEENGESLLIPEDYKGWFSVLPRTTGLSVIEDNVPHFATVEELASSNSERFLIGGTKRLTGLQINNMSSLGKLDHTQRHIFPGEIMTREKIYFGETKKKSRLFRKPKYIVEKFLMCRDENDQELLLPFEQQGIFYQVSHSGGKAHKNVLQMSDIVARKMTPRLMKLVYGRFPVTECSFTGLMRAESSDIEMSVIACTLVKTKNLLLEIPVSSAMRFRIALTNDSLRLNVCYRTAISMCAERANTYMRNIKICLNYISDENDPVGDSVRNRNRSNSFDFDALQPSPRQTESAGIKKSYGSLKRPMGQNASDQRFSESMTNSVCYRPVRSLSTGRMSFCLGNSYLTVPLFDKSSQQKRDSGNNNSIHQTASAIKAGYRLSINGQLFEEEVNDEQGDCNAATDNPETIYANENVPPPCPNTNASSHINIVDPPSGTNDSEFKDYIPTSANHGPTSHAPVSAPPPVPVSSTNNDVMLDTSSPYKAECTAQTMSTEVEYAVPKLGEPSKCLTLNDSNDKTQDKKQPMTRRPSTFTFSEGCRQFKRVNGKQDLLSPDEVDSDFEDDCVIYENIKTLMEEVTAKETLLGNEIGIQKEVYPAERVDENEGSVDSESSLASFRSEITTYCNDITQNIDQSKYPGDQNPIKENPEVVDEQLERLENETTDTDGTVQDGKAKERVRKCGVVNIDTRHLTKELENGVTGTINDAENSSSEVFNYADVDNRVHHEFDDKSYNATGHLDEDGYEKRENGVANGYEYKSNEVEAGTFTENKDSSSNGKLWLEGLKKTTDNQSRTPSPQSPCEEEDIRLMSSSTVAEKLKLIGVREATSKKIAELGIDGKALYEVLSGDTPISECLEGINLVDQQKVSMFIRGWRPDMDYI